MEMRAVGHWAAGKSLTVAERFGVLSAIPVRVRSYLLQGAGAALLLGLGIVLGKTLAWVLIAGAVVVIALMALATWFDQREPQRGKAKRFAPLPKTDEHKSAPKRAAAQEALASPDPGSAFPPVSPDDAARVGRISELRKREPDDIKQPPTVEPRVAAAHRVVQMPITPQATRWLRHQRERGQDELHKIAEARKALLARKSPFGLTEVDLALTALTRSVTAWSDALSSGLKRMGLTDAAETVADKPPESVAPNNPTTGDYDRLSAYVKARTDLLWRLLGKDGSAAI